MLKLAKEQGSRMSRVIRKGRFAAEVRRARGSLAREKLAAQIGVSSGTVENWEQGVIPDVPNLLAACSYFGWPVVDAITWIEQDLRERGEDMGRYLSSSLAGVA